jgi:uncharacterized membrane protein YhaH (DUF805 family)
MQSIKICEACGTSSARQAEICSWCGSALPTATRELVEKATGWRWFVGLDGRVNRGGFFVRELIVIGLIATVVVIAGSVPGAISGWVSIVLLVTMVAIQVSSIVRRFHDKGKSGYSFFLLWIPLLNILIWVQLFADSGEGHSNNHGQHPEHLEVGL